MTHDFACRYEKIRAFAEKFLADGGLSPVISKKYIIVFVNMLDIELTKDI